MLVIHIMSLPTSPRRSPHSTQQIIDLTFLSEEEETRLRSVLEEDRKLQQAEENRLKYILQILSLLFFQRIITFYRSLRESIAQDAMKYATSRPGTQCTRCGTRFGWIFNTGALCPTCSERVCKRDRLYDSYAHTWMCTLCDKRM